MIHFVLCLYDFILQLFQQLDINLQFLSKPINTIKENCIVLWYSPRCLFIYLCLLLHPGAL